MAKAKTEKAGEIVIQPMQTVAAKVWILGTSPLVMNRLAEKARQELLMPSPPKNRAEKLANLKHRPYDEYRASVYRRLGGDNGKAPPTRLVFPGGGLRKAIASAALDVPGSSKAQIGRLVRVEEYNLSVYGVPRIYCAIVRQAGINKTPDVRTRAIVPEWCCQVTVRFAHPILKQAAVFSLLEAAGDFIGIGDGRNEKGSSLSFGCFKIAKTDEEMEEVDRIRKSGGLKAQDAALLEPEFYDDETRELLTWFNRELLNRGDKVTFVKDDEEEDEEVEAEEGYPVAP